EQFADCERWVTLRASRGWGRRWSCRHRRSDPPLQDTRRGGEGRRDGSPGAASGGSKLAHAGGSPGGARTELDLLRLRCPDNQVEAVRQFATVDMTPGLAVSGTSEG